VTLGGGSRWPARCGRPGHGAPPHRSSAAQRTHRSICDQRAVVKFVNPQRGQRT
jgi:hypothetical protein